MIPPDFIGQLETKLARDKVLYKAVEEVLSAYDGLELHFPAKIEDLASKIVGAVRNQVDDHAMKFRRRAQEAEGQLERHEVFLKEILIDLQRNVNRTTIVEKILCMTKK